MAQHGDSNKEFPLQGVILCCTSIPPEKRSDLAAIASQMGAIHKLDLTSDVTHLIVGDTDTPKYKFVARERPDVKCLMATWIDAVRDSWMNGGDTEVESLERQHQLPTFHGLRICVTGFDDLAYRKELEDLINDNGGQYRGNLTKEVTHLIAKVPSGPKYTYAGDWGIKIVSIEWLNQSLERGMILEENLFHLLLPASERGRNAWIRKTSTTSPLGKRARDDTGPVLSRKLRRTASAKLNSQTNGLWTDIVAAGTESQGGKANEWDDEQRSNASHDGFKKPGTAQTPTAEPSVVKVGTQLWEQGDKGGKTILGLTRRSHDAGIFQGKRFYVYGFKQKQSSVLRAHLLSHEAEIEEDFLQFCAKLERLKVQSGYLLVPYNLLRSEVPEAPQGSNYFKVVTDMWLERCLHSTECVDPGADTTSAPFRLFPIPGFESTTICSTSLRGVDLLHLSKAVKLIGAKYDEFLTPNALVLVCDTLLPAAEKIKYAVEWKVPIVSSKWLWDSIQEGQRKPFDPYLIGGTENHLPIANPKPSDDTTKAIKAEIHSNPLTRTTKDNKKRLLLGRTLDLVKTEDTPQLIDNPNSRVIEESPIKNKTPCLDTIGTSEVHTNIDSPNPDEYDINAEQPSRPMSAPLKEISLNSSPKASASPTKVLSPSKSAPPAKIDDGDSLGPAITSLLAHHQRLTTTNPPAKPTDDSNFGRRRRRRQLLGRAASSMSARSNGSISMSRASSVDTMNTDGLGTPLESSTANTRDEVDESFASLHSFGEKERFRESVEQPPQMTQLSYEDPDVRAWRERVVKKLGGVGQIEPDAGKRADGIGVVTDVGGRGAKGVGRRTRQALGR